MQADRTLLYDSSNDFFELDGTAVMKLTSAAAQDVCKQALIHGNRSPPLSTNSD